MLAPGKITVFGAGVWGSVLAAHLAKKNYNVCLWERFPHLLGEISQSRKHPHIPHFTFPENVSLTGSLSEAASGCEFGVMAVSSKAVREFSKDLAKVLNGAHFPFVSATKGLEEGTHLTPCEIIEKEIPSFSGRAMALSGPGFAVEIARGVPTRLVLAGHDGTLVGKTRALLEGKRFKIDISDDRRGVEWGGAIKNVLAIGCGILDGLGLGANAKAALITQGAAELGLIVRAVGGKERTVYGPACLGDLILTATGEVSRNRRLGEKLGQGKAVAQARGEISTVAEGVDSVESAHAAATARNLDVPVVNALWRIIREGEPPGILLAAMGF